LKKRILVAVLALLIAPVMISPLAAEKTIDSKIRKAFEKISDAYIKEHPAGSTKTGLALLPFDEGSELAKSNGLGGAVREILARIAGDSQVFYLVDRDTMGQLMKEMELSMSGTVKEGTGIEAGKIAGVQAFIKGSITEVGANFQVSLKIIDAESATVSGAESFDIPRNDLVRRRDEIAISHIAQYGMGINFQYSMGFITSPAPYSLQYFDVFANYRPWLWLNFKLGVTSMNLGFKEVNGIQANKIYKDMPASPPITISNISYKEGDMTEFSPYVGADINVIVSDKFTVGFGIGLNYFQEPILTQHYSPLYHDDNINDNPGDIIQKGGVFDVVQEFNPLYLMRFEIKPQFFVSPRFTIGLYFAFILANNPKVYKAVINNEYTGFLSEPGGLSDHEKEMKEKYLGMPLSIIADGGDVNDLSFNRSIAMGLSLNFYF
jgi:TolB-like protein